MGATHGPHDRGRWGLNLVTGLPAERDRHVRPRADPARPALRHGGRVHQILERLWREDANITFKGDYWTLKDAYVSPKPVHGRPIMVNAGSSDAGLAYAAKYSDLIFITSPGGADIADALATLPAHNRRIKGMAAAEGARSAPSSTRMWSAATPSARCARLARRSSPRRTAGGRQPGRRMGRGDQASWRGHERNQRIIGGNVHVFGTPEQMVDQFIKLKAAGCDGMQINFFDFEPDLAYFGEAGHAAAASGGAARERRCRLTVGFFPHDSVSCGRSVVSDSSYLTARTFMLGGPLRNGAAAH